MRAERGSSDTDEDWLPEVSDVISGNFHVMVDLTDDSDSEVCQHLQELSVTRTADHCSAQNDAESSMHPLSDSGTVLASPCPTSALPSSFNQRPPPACQPSTADDLDREQVEIPETPEATLVSLVDANEDSNQEQEEEEEQEQEAEGPDWEDSNSDRGGGVPPSRQPDAPILVSTIQLLESGMIPERQSPEAMTDHQLGSQSVSRIESPMRQAMCTGSGTCMGIQDISFLHIEGLRETVRGPEYLCVGKVWLQSSAGVPSDLLRTYRREAVRMDRLATLRSRKRMSKEVTSVQATRRKRVKQT